MDIKKCPNCQKQFDKDKRVSKLLTCGCISCLKCLNFFYKLTKEIKCKIHQQVYNINPEDLQDYVVQEPFLQDLLQPQEKFIDQEKITDQFNCLQDQYVQAQNHNRMIMKVIQDSSQFFQHTQSLAIHEILKSLDQFSISNDKIKNLLKRLSEFKVVNEVQQQQVLRVVQQDPHVRQNTQGQLQEQFQQILFEIEKLKKDQQMDLQSLRVNVQRCMFGMFVYLSESSKNQLLTGREAECLVQKYFKQFKVQRGLSQVSNSVVQQKDQLQSQNIDQQLIQESQNFELQNQNQTIDKQQGQDIVQVKQFLNQQEVFQQEKQVIDAKLMFQQMKQKLMSILNNFSFTNQINQSIQEQAMSIVPISPVIITFDNFILFLNQIKEENVSIQTLQFSPLNKSGLLEYPQILYQLSTVTDQQICLKLSQIIQLAKNQSQIQLSATNALTILNYMNFQFNNQNFSNLDLKKSDLSDTTFHNCNFVNSNLTQANLRNTKFINCDFTSSNLTSIITEHPHIFTGHTGRVDSLAISSDSNFIVSGSDDNTVRLWDIRTGNSKTLSGHKGPVFSIAISSDSEFIVSGS